MATPIPPNEASFTLKEIASATHGTIVDPEGASGGDSVLVRGVSTDSRTVPSGALFVALRGERMDAHQFLDAAHARGAVLLVERGRALPDGARAVAVDDTLVALGALAAVHRARFPGLVVAVTGSAGKTTTKELVAAALAGTGARTLRTHGNLNNLIGVPMMLFLLDAEQHDAAVIEVGTSAPGEVARLAAIVQPRIAVCTLAAAEHLEGLGTLDAVADEETACFRALPDDGAIIPGADDTRVLARAQGAKGARTLLSFGVAASSDIRLISRTHDPDGTQRARYSLRYSLPGPQVGPKEGEGEIELVLALLGAAAAVDAGAALAVVLATRPEKLDAAAAALAKVSPVAGRMVPRAGRRGVLVLDDTYNANPGSVRASIDTAVELAHERQGRALAVLGDMKELGAASAAEHEGIGRYAVERGVAVLIGCGREMAAAASAAVRSAAGRGAVFPTRVVQVAEVLDAIPVVDGLMRDGDVVLVKGSRSMTMERVVDALAAERSGA